MLRIHFTAEDLRRTRIAGEPDPLWEVLLSLHLVQSKHGQVVYGPWRRSTRSAAHRGDLQLLWELAPPVGYSPDFLTPNDAGPRLEQALDRLAVTPRARIRTQLNYFVTRQGTTRWIRELVSAEAATMRRLSRAVESYYRTALEPYWPSIRKHVVADRARRVQQWTSQGIDHMLSGLPPGIRWNPPVLEVADFVDTDLYLDGRGLVLQPSFFCWQTPTKLRDPDQQPVLVYPTQPAPGAIYRQWSGRPAKLVALLGQTRAAALEATVSGCTTTELASACGVSLPAASQQAKVLRDASLISTRRVGEGVRHEITALGLSLLDGRELAV